MGELSVAFCIFYHKSTWALPQKLKHIQEQFLNASSCGHLDARSKASTAVPSASGLPRVAWLCCVLGTRSANNSGGIRDVHADAFCHGLSRHDGVFAACRGCDSLTFCPPYVTLLSLPVAGTPVSALVVLPSLDGVAVFAFLLCTLQALRGFACGEAAFATGPEAVGGRSDGRFFRGFRQSLRRSCASLPYVGPYLDPS